MTLPYSISGVTNPIENHRKLFHHSPSLINISYHNGQEDPTEGSDYETGYFDEREPSNVDDINAWDSATEHLFSVLRLTTTGAARSLLLQFEPKPGRPGDGKQAWLVL